MIKYVVKSENGMVMVFDEKGEQIPEYQGRYEEVKDKILRDAPLNATFEHVINLDRSGVEAVSREEW